ncbi:MAG TPA: class I tRNA ligase family protein, partial [Saprospiraceae bacterium]|nr:class I tRNA ligase family protein [Saprospiraceae bacterium]
AKDRLIELNKTINWKPASTGEKRFGNWLENLQDWNLSRSRYWGIPLPIWRNESGDVEKCIGSIEELKIEIEKANHQLGLSQSVPKDLHRPYIDEVILVSENGESLRRELDLIDVWFDSGSMPYAQWHYPFENEDKINKHTSFPADFIAEGVDQTRGWFYTLHAIAAMVFDSVAYKNVVSNGLVLDKNGVKMSKRLGNVIDPFEAIREHGADANRWYMIANAPPWDNLKFDLAGVEEVKRKFFGTLYNTYAFFALYANIDQFKYDEKTVPIEERPEIDRWIISSLNSLIEEVKTDYQEYEPTNATRKIQYFLDDQLSNWYVRLCRRRFWKGEYSNDKIAAYQTLYECMVGISKLMAPVAPFFADWLFKNLNDPTKLESVESVHLSLFPNANLGAIDKPLEQRMEYAQRISSLVLSIRKKEMIRVRQPLQRIMLPILDENFKLQVEAVKDLILSEVNIKEIEYITDTTGVIVKKAKPNFKTLGRRLGKDMKAGAEMINSLTELQISDLEKNGILKLNINGSDYELIQEDIEIISEDIPGWQVATDKDITVALDIGITEELMLEGIARELVNRIQNLRKSSDFNVTDRIKVIISETDLVNQTLNHFKEYIANEVLADSIESGKNNGEETELIEGLIVNIEVNKNEA